ncbi:MAG: hypothetical protein PHT07_10460 [Paludibacter sp.]|nr:hypothetical protein [Paludibacter sp.]
MSSAEENHIFDEDLEGIIIGQNEGKWVLSVLKEAMVVLYRLTEDDELKSAIRTGKMLASEDEEKEKVYMLSAFFREEMSGNLKPPPALKRLYKQIAEDFSKNH